MVVDAGDPLDDIKAAERRQVPVFELLCPHVHCAVVMPIDSAWSWRAQHGIWRFYSADRPGAEVIAVGRRWPLRRDALLLLPPAVSYDTACRQSVRHMYIHADITGLSAHAEAAAFTEPLLIPAKPTLEGLLDGVWDSPRDDAMADASLVWRAQGLVAAALAVAIERIPEARRSALMRFLQGHDRIQAVLMWMRGRLAEPCPNEALARIYGAGVDPFLRAFRRACQTSPQRWLRRQRLRRAAILLSGGAVSVADVAASVGLPDPRHFSRLFTREFGVAPSRWR